MRVFRDLPIGRKLYGLAGPLIGFLVLVGVLGLTTLSSSATQSRGMYQNATLPIAQLDKARSQLGNVDADLVKAVTSTSGASQDMSAVQKDAGAFEQALKTYTSSALSSAEQAVYGPAQTAWSQLKDVAATIGKDAQAGGAASRQAGSKLYFSSAAPLNNQIDQRLAQLVTLNATQAAANASSIESSYSSSRTLTIVILAIAVLLAAGIAFLVTRVIRSSVKQIMERLELLKDKGADRLTGALKALAEGHLTHEFQIDINEVTEFPADELGSIQRTVEELRGGIVTSLEAYSTTRAKLNALTGDVSGSAERVSAASEQMAATSEETGKATGEIAHAVADIAQGAERQVQMAEQARSAAAEVSAAVLESAANAQLTAEVAHQAREVAQQGVGAAENANGAMRAVRESSEAVNGAIRELAAKSGQIGAIQGETTNAVSVVERGARRTADGAAVVEQAREAFLQIGASVDDMTGRIEQIAAAAEDCAASAETMQASIVEVAAVAAQSSASTEEVSASTEQTSASAQEITASAQELSRDAEDLNRLVAQFTLAA